MQSDAFYQINMDDSSAKKKYNNLITYLKQKWNQLTSHTQSKSKEMDSQLTQGTEKTKGAFKNAFSGLKQMAQGFFMTLGALISSTLVAKVQEAIQAFSGLDKGIREVATLLTDKKLSEVGGLQGLKEDAKELAYLFGENIKNVTGAMYDAISSGVDASTLKQTMEEAGKLAVGGVTDLKTAIGGISAAYNSYGKTVNDVKSITDTYFIGMKNGITTVDKLANQISKVSPLAAQMGVSFEESIGAMSAITTQKVDTSVAATMLQNVLKSIIKPTTAAQKAMKELNIEFGENALKNKSLLQYLQEVKAKLEATKRPMTEIFTGTKALNGALILTGSAADKYKDIMYEMAKSTENAGAITNRAFKLMEESASMQMQRLKLQVGESFQDLMIKLLPVVNEIFGVFRKLSPLLSAIGTAIKKVFDSDLMQTALGLINNIADGLSRFIAPIDTAKTKFKELYHELLKINEVLAVFNELDDTAFKELNLESEEFIKQLEKIKAVAPEVAEKIEQIAKAQNLTLEEKELGITKAIKNFNDEIKKSQLEKQTQSIKEFSLSLSNNAIEFNKYKNVYAELMKKREEGIKLTDDEIDKLAEAEKKIKEYKTNMKVDASALFEMGITQEQIDSQLNDIVKTIESFDLQGQMSKATAGFEGFSMWEDGLDNSFTRLLSIKETTAELYSDLSGEEERAIERQKEIVKETEILQKLTEDIQSGKVKIDNLDSATLNKLKNHLTVQQNLGRAVKTYIGNISGSESAISTLMENISGALDKVNTALEKDSGVLDIERNAELVKSGYDALTFYIEKQWEITSENIASGQITSLEDAFAEIELSNKLLQQKIKDDTMTSEAEKTQLLLEVEKQRQEKTVSLLSGSGSYLSTRAEIEDKIADAVKSAGDNYDGQIEALKNILAMETAKVEVLKKQAEAEKEKLLTKREEYKILKANAELEKRAIENIFKEAGTTAKEAQSTYNNLVSQYHDDAIAKSDPIGSLWSKFATAYTMAEMEINSYGDAITNIDTNIHKLDESLKTQDEIMYDVNKQINDSINNIETYNKKVNDSTKEEKTIKERLYEELQKLQAELNYEKSQEYKNYNGINSLLNDIIRQYEAINDEIEYTEGQTAEYYNNLTNINNTQKEIDDLYKSEENYYQDKMNALQDVLRLAKLEGKNKEQLLTVEKEYLETIDLHKVSEQQRLDILSRINDLENEIANIERYETLNYLQEKLNATKIAGEQLVNKYILDGLELEEGKAQALLRELDVLREIANETLLIHKDTLGINTLDEAQAFTKEQIANFTEEQLKAYQEIMSAVTAVSDIEVELLDIEAQKTDQIKQQADEEETARKAKKSQWEIDKQNELAAANAMLEINNEDEEALKKKNELTKELENYYQGIIDKYYEAYIAGNLEGEQLQEFVNAYNEILSLKEKINEETDDEINLAEKLLELVQFQIQSIGSAFSNGILDEDEILSSFDSLAKNGVQLIIELIGGSFGSQIAGAIYEIGKGIFKSITSSLIDTSTMDAIEAETAAIDAQLAKQEKINDIIDTRNQYLELAKSFYSDIADSIEEEIAYNEETLRQLQEEYDLLLASNEEFLQQEEERQKKKEQYETELTSMESDLAKINQLSTALFAGDWSSIKKFGEQYGIEKEFFETRDEYKDRVIAAIEAEIDLQEKKIKGLDGETDALEKIAELQETITQLKKDKLNEDKKIAVLEAELAGDEEAAIQAEIDYVNEMLARADELNLSTLERLELQKELLDLQEELNKEMNTTSWRYNDLIKKQIELALEAQAYGDTLKENEALKTAASELAAQGLDLSAINELLGTAYESFKDFDYGTSSDSAETTSITDDILVSTAIDTNSLISQEIETINESNTLLAKINESIANGQNVEVIIKSNDNSTTYSYDTVKNINNLNKKFFGRS